LLSSDSIEIEGIQKLLAGLDKNIKINFSYHSVGNWTNCDLSSENETILKYFSLRFKLGTGKHLSFNAMHEVYSNEHNERHYIDINTKVILNSDNKRKERSYEDATLMYTLKNC
jgi:hypothetical protein